MAYVVIRPVVALEALGAKIGFVGAVYWYTCYEFRNSVWVKKALCQGVWMPFEGCRKMGVI